MDAIRKWSKSNPPAPGSIPYGPYSYDAGNGCVYSIDKFRPRFPLRWGDLSVSKHGKVIALNDDTVLDAVRSTIIQPLISQPVRHDKGRLPGNVYWWSFDGVLVTLQRFKPFGSDTPNYSLLMEFNPNKHFDNPVIPELISALRLRLSEFFVWHNTRMDFALDIPFPISDVRLLTRKIGSSYMGTYYFGARGKSGYTRVYDKRKELIEKQRKDIGREVTRIEWESRSGDPVHMDFPFIIQNLGRYEVLRFVNMADWPAALRTYDERTAAKIRRNCLRAVDVDPTVFDRLSAQLLSDLGLTADQNHDHLERERMAAVDMENLEKIQSQLRKWSGVEH